jgi:hypothetical protein
VNIELLSDNPKASNKILINGIKKKKNRKETGRKRIRLAIARLRVFFIEIIPK